MLHLPVQLLIGSASLALACALRALSGNRFVSSRLRFSILLAFAYLAINTFLALPEGQPLRPGLGPIADLLLALAAITVVVTLALNPLRDDRGSGRFPNIVQDAIVIALFLLIATFVMQEKFLTTSAVSAVVLGFALQDTFGNMFAGLAIQVEKPFQVGQWVEIGKYEGKVSQITWRATKLRAKRGYFIIIPNNLVSKEAITNYSEPGPAMRLQVDVGASYDVRPNRVKETIYEALKYEAAVLRSPPPEVLVFEFGASAVIYRIRFWIDDFARDETARDRVRSAVYYAFEREQIEIPYPIQVEYFPADKTETADARVARLSSLLDGVDLLAPLTEQQRMRLVAECRERLFGGGERIVTQDDAGSSMFLITDGSVRVLVEPGNREVARLAMGAYFGEMSLLTGEPRAATVTAAGDCRVLEITVETFKRLIGANPEVLEQISLVVANRRIELERARNVAAAFVPPREMQRSLFARMQQFFRR